MNNIILYFKKRIYLINILFLLLSTSIPLLSIPLLNISTSAALNALSCTLGTYFGIRIVAPLMIKYILLNPVFQDLKNNKSNIYLTLSIVAFLISLTTTYTNWVDLQKLNILKLQLSVHLQGKKQDEAKSSKVLKTFLNLHKSRIDELSQLLQDITLATLPQREALAKLDEEEDKLDSSKIFSEEIFIDANKIEIGKMVLQAFQDNLNKRKKLMDDMNSAEEQAVLKSKISYELKQSYQKRHPQKIYDIYQELFIAEQGLFDCFNNLLDLAAANLNSTELKNGKLKFNNPEVLKEYSELTNLLQKFIAQKHEALGYLYNETNRVMKLLSTS